MILAATRAKYEARACSWFGTLALVSAKDEARACCCG